jgi:hypothetical protein
MSAPLNYFGSKKMGVLSTDFGEHVRLQVDFVVGDG